MQTLLLGCVVFSLFLFFLFRVNVVHAEDMVNPPLDVTDDDNPPTKDPGNGGGGGGGGSPPPYRQIRVRVVDYETGVAVPGINVYINLPMPVLIGQTNANGYVIYTTVSGHPYPNTNYRITVNGQDYYNLGVWPEDYHWGQRATTITTDNNAYAHVTIPLQHAAIVNVVAAAFFSNTKYAKIKYVMGETSKFDHTLTFSVATSGVQIGYSTTTTASREFEIGANNKRFVYRPHYANTYIDDSWGVIKTGISKAVETIHWSLNETYDYLNPFNIPTGSFEDVAVTPGDLVADTYTEEGSHTWSITGGVPFAIAYRAYSLLIYLDITVTVTQGVTNTVKWEIDRRGDTDPRTLWFRIYTCSTSYNRELKRGGFEIHIWNLNWTG